MPTFAKLKSGSWRVQVRRKREYVANTFIRRRDAEEWAIEVERSIDRGVPIRRSRPHEQPRIFADLIALHLDDLAQVGKPVRRSKSMVLKALKASLGRVKLKDITRDRLIEFARNLAKGRINVSKHLQDHAAIERMRLQHLFFISHPDIASVSSKQLFETDAAFHEMCAEFCGNAFFAQSIQYQNRLRRLLEFGSYFDSRRVREWCREHLAIIESVAAGDLEQASARMRAHLEQALISAQVTAK